MKGITRLTLQIDGEETSCTHDVNDLTTNDLLHDFVTVMYGQTFMIETIVSAMKEFIEEYEDNETN